MVSEFSLGDLNFKVFDGVYAPSHDSFTLFDAVSGLDDDLGLGMDLGCGCGIVTLPLARKCRHVFAVDLNLDAVRNVIYNSLLNGLYDRISVIYGDLLSPFMVGRIFDVIVFNPPYLPVDDYDLLVPLSLRRNWSGGLNGRQLIDRFILEFASFLRDDGVLLLVQSSLSDVDLTVKRFMELGFDVEVLDVRHFFYESISILKVFRG